eukprot:scaffold381_cov138-Cylindrotheca_fusiformis.AAC.9
MTRLVGPSLVLILLSGHVAGRTWKDISLVHSLDIPEEYLAEGRRESDPFYYEPPRHPVESENPPGATPTADPRPCPGCDDYTLTPEEKYPTNDVPTNPPRDYFNYDVSIDAKYGPGYPSYFQYGNGYRIHYLNNGWANFQKSNNFDYYWDEFSSNGFGAYKGVLANHDMDTSICGSGNIQSPIDIRLSGVACVETHQIRHRPGDFRVEGSNVRRQILGSKLRLLYDRRPCRDLSKDACKEPDPPFADFPNGWAGNADVMHVDFKLPAEHQIYGEKFDAEMQVYHLHPGRRLIPAVSILFRVQSDGYNTVLQQAIDAFQYEFDRDQAKCSNRIRRDRKLVSEFHTKIMDNDVESPKTDYRNWGEFSTQLDDPEFPEEAQHTRRMQEKFNPYHEELMRTVYFYGYDGSLTEPPCTEIVSWFIMDEPATMSLQQLEQMRNILFNHVDKDCLRTSVHDTERGVSRPVQDTNDRMVWHCTRDHFPPDSERKNN